jgi:hypothetical protein
MPIGNDKPSKKSFVNKALPSLLLGIPILFQDFGQVTKKGRGLVDIDLLLLVAVEKERFRSSRWHFH